MTTDAGDAICEKLQQQAAVTTVTDTVTTTTDIDDCTAAVAMPTTTNDADKYALANALLQQVDDNIVKTATLRKQMPAKCAQLLARRCRLILTAAVSMSQR